MILAGLCALAVAAAVAAHRAPSRPPVRHARRGTVHYDLAPPPAPDAWPLRERERETP